MDTIIQSLGFTAGNSLETFIQEKVNTLKGDSIIRANVTLFKGPSSSPEADYCEIRLEIPGNDLFVKKHSLHYEVSVSECVEILSHQLEKLKGRNTNKQADADLIQDALLEGEEDNDDVELEDVVR